MNVDDAIRKRIDHRWAQHAHEAGQTHQIDLTSLEFADKRTIVRVS